MSQTPADRLTKLRAIGARMDPEKVEIDRILSLPVEKGMEPEDLEIFSMSRMLMSAYESGKRLKAKQCLALDAYERIRGGFFPLQVGAGKTGVSLMVANHAYQTGIERILLLIPASLVAQLVKRDIPMWRKMVPLNVPFHVMAGRTKAWRKMMAASGAPGCYILPYSLLSQLDSNDMLDGINAGLIIADEVHKLKNKRAAVSKRILARLNPEDGKPAPEFVCMSGTITKKQIADYHHLLQAALKVRSPLPHSASMAYVWGQMLDTTAGLRTDTRTAHLMGPLVQWARDWFPGDYTIGETESIRRAYKHRLNTCPGVVSSSELDGIPNGLLIKNEPAPIPDSPEYQQLLSHIDDLDKAAMTPNGDIIPHAMNAWKWYYEMAQGFYNKLLWPTPEWMMKHRHVSESEAEDLISRAKVHHTYEQAYDKVLRDFFKSAPLGLDTPREVGLAIFRKDKRIWGEIYQAHDLMVAHDFEGRPKRLPEAVRVCDFKVMHAKAWCAGLPEGEGGIVWYYNREMGKWLYDELKNAGFDVFYAPAGANEEIADPTNKHRICVASIKAHHVGKNLQFWSRQLVVQWPRDSELAEQMLGRMHRDGQEADVVETTTTNTSEFEHAVLAACLHDTIYAAQTIGGSKRLLIASYSPLPKVFSPEFLREKGMSVEDLTSEQMEMLRENFGDFAD